MTKLIELLTKEKDLNVLLNSPKCPSNIDDQFKELFNDSFYKKTHEFYQKNGISSLHDSYVKDFSQKRKVNYFDISFKIDHTLIYDKDEEVGYLENSQFKLSSSQSLRDINDKCILSFLIDEDKKEVAFLFLENNQRKVVRIEYKDIEFVKGKEVFYENQKTNKPKM